MLALDFPSLLALTPEKGQHLEVCSPREYLWITIEGMSQDIVLAPGQIYELPAGRHVVVQALKGKP